MSDYYRECYQTIKELIQNNELEKAHQLIEEELRMPYVPQEFESKLLALDSETRQAIVNKTLSALEIADYLLQDETHQLIAVKALSEQNIRKYVDLIQEAFDHAKSKLVTISLMEVCIQQQLNEEFRIEKDGMEIYFVPSVCVLPLESEGVEKCIHLLQNWLENENPSLCEMCCQCVIKESYLRLPFEIEEEESEDMAVAIVSYVSKLMGIENQMQQLLSEKSTSQKDSFELLLYSNII